MSIESENKFLAVHSEFTTYTVFSNLDKCKEMRNIFLCHKCALFQKAKGKYCLFNRYSKKENPSQHTPIKS